jgi:hypothetical protein
MDLFEIAGDLQEQKDCKFNLFTSAAVNPGNDCLESTGIDHIQELHLQAGKQPAR